MNGIKAELAKPTKRAAPMSLKILMEIEEKVNYGIEYEFCCYATMLSGFYLTVRSSNLVPSSTKKFNPEEQLTRWHVGFDEKVVTFLIEWSKNNQNKGKELWIPVSRAKNPKVCLVRVMKKFCDTVKAGPHDPCFCYHNEKNELKALTYDQLNYQMKEWVNATGRQGDSYTTHALRRGGINHGIRSGLSPLYLKLIGDWSSLCFLKYVDFDLDMRVRATLDFNN